MRAGLARTHCPKCGGCIYLDIDYFLDGELVSWYEYGSCLQCGYIYYPDTAVRTEEKVVGSAPVPVKITVGAR